MSFNAQVSKTIKRIHQAKKNGALIGQAGTLKRLLFFEEGQLVGCRSSLPTERLGGLLVREGRITQEQLSHATEEIRTGLKMGQILVGLGYLKGGEIEGIRVYKSLDEIPVERLNRVSLYVPPAVGLTLVEQISHSAWQLGPVLAAPIRKRAITWVVG